MSPALKLGWAFFGLCCVVVFAYALNRGIYVGSRADMFQTGEDPKSKQPVYREMKVCTYLYPSGIAHRLGDDSCRLFGSN